MSLTARVPSRPGPSAVKLLLTPTEAAQALSISRSFLYQLIMHNQVRSVKVGGARRIPLKALQDYVNELATSRE